MACQPLPGSIHPCWVVAPRTSQLGAVDCGVGVSVVLKLAWSSQHGVQRILFSHRRALPPPHQERSSALCCMEEDAGWMGPKRGVEGHVGQARVLV